MAKKARSVVSRLVRNRVVRGRRGDAILLIRFRAILITSVTIVTSGRGRSRGYQRPMPLRSNCTYFKPNAQGMEPNDQFWTRDQFQREFSILFLVLHNRVAHANPNPGPNQVLFLLYRKHTGSEQTCVGER